MKYKKNAIHSLFWFVIILLFVRVLLVALVSAAAIFALSCLVDVSFLVVKHFIEYYGLENKLSQEMLKDY